MAAPDPVGVPAAVPAVMLEDTAALKTCPTVGSATPPFTFQTPLVYAGQEGAEREGVYALAETPVGESVAH